MRKRKLKKFLDVAFFYFVVIVLAFSVVADISILMRSRQINQDRRKQEALESVEHGTFMIKGIAEISILDASKEEPVTYYTPAVEVDAYEPFIIECSAYCYNGRCTASGKPTIEGLTIAGKKEWLGRTAVLYEINDDGGIGQFIGYREFTDTGYGQDSTLYPGKGTIQTGECVDLYFDDEQTALEWGRKKIYIQVIDGRG